MTVNEAINNFKLYYNEKTGVEAYGFLDSEIKQFLEDAQMDLVGDKAFGENFRGPVFESNQRRVAELETLLQESSLTPLESTSYLDYKAELPTGDTGFMYYVRSKSKVDRSDYPEGIGINVKNIFVRHDWLDNFEEYGRNNHFIEPRVTISNGFLYLKVDSFTTDITSVKLSYIRKPASINVSGNESSDIDLPFNMHDQLVQTAVRKALAPETPREQRYQVQAAEEKKTTD